MYIALSVYESTTIEPQILCFSYVGFLYTLRKSLKSYVPDSFGKKSCTVPSGKPMLFIGGTINYIIAFISMK